MKRVLLLTVVLVLASAFVFADATNKTTDSAKVKLDLNVEKIVTGFTDSEAKAQKFQLPDDADHEFVISSSNDGDNVNIKTAQSGEMYFFYDAALDKDLTYTLKAKIDTALIQQNEDDNAAATDPDVITYKAKVSGSVAEVSGGFKDGTWVKKDEAITLSSPSDAETTQATFTTIRADLRDSNEKPFTVAYAGAFKIELTVDDNQNLGKKNAAVYRSTITFAIEANG